ncbi:hypothetical protein JCM10213v2_002426 [Rhodosporidiobolus nylandii]
MSESSSPAASGSSRPSSPPSSTTSNAGADDSRLPVTILSGFLGSGKSTLLEHVLTSKDHGLRCAVIVNDMGEVNIDAALVDSHKTLQTEEKIVQLENAGISEPQQVAETFAPEFSDEHLQTAEALRAEASQSSADSGKVAAQLKLAEILGKGGLPKVARLDTCVTMVDALSFFDNFATTDFLSDRDEPGAVDEQDERNISDLLTDQVEFANVLIVNKCDLVSPSQLDRIVSLLRTLNPAAEILTSVRSKVDLQKILNTRRFNFEEAVLSAGWLKSLKEEHVPETVEYGIGSFVYRARRPFHPLRLWNVIRSRLVVIQDSYEAAMQQEMDEDGSDHSDAESDGSWEEEPDLDAQPQLDPVARLAAKKADPAFAPLLRSKGFFWLATRPLMSGEWSQAGVMLTISGGSRWLCETELSSWPSDPRVQAKMRADFQGRWGDRRQELVFIGEQLETMRPLITAELDDALLDNEEWKEWQKIMKASFPFSSP